MTLAELIAEFRVATRDLEEPYLFDDEWIAQWLADAEIEACIRARLLHEVDNADVCEIAVSAGAAVYPLHPALYEITHIAFRPDGASRRDPVKLVSTEWLDDNLRDWRDLEGPATFAVQDDTRIRLVPRPSQPGTLLLEGYRLPLAPLTTEPEIHRAHHRHLVQYALSEAYRQPDTDTIDLDRSALAEREFERYFGRRPDADLRRITRHDVEHHNKAWP